jgi:hypothetical protein
MARTAPLKKSAATPSGAASALLGRETAYHGDIVGHQKIMEALGAVPELNDAMPRVGGAMAETEQRWHPLKTFFFVIVFCATAWATISAAVLMAFR